MTEPLEERIDAFLDARLGSAADYAAMQEALRVANEKLAQWQAVGDAIMLCAVGRVAPLSDSDVCGVLSDLRNQTTARRVGVDPPPASMQIVLGYWDRPWKPADAWMTVRYFDDDEGVQEWEVWNGNNWDFCVAPTYWWPLFQPPQESTA